MNKTKIFDEIIDYCDSEQNYSYYDMMTYACKAKPDWVEAIRDKKFRKSVSMYLKSRKRTMKTKYNTSFDETYKNYSCARREYENKRDQELFEAIEASVENA